MIRILRFFFYSFDNSLLLLLIISLLAGYISPGITWLAPFLSFAFPVLLLLYFSFLTYAFFRNRKWKIKLLILVILGGIFFKNQFAIGNINSDTSDIRIMGFNARLFDLYNWIDRESWAEWSPRTDNGKTLNKIYSTIKKASPDVICIQEYYYQTRSAYATRDTLRKYGFRYKHIEILNEGKTKGAYHQYGIATFSKYPIIKKSNLGRDEGFKNGALVSDIKIKEDTIRVINAHFDSYRFSKENYHTINRLKNIEQDSIETNDIFNIVYATKKGILSRWEEIQKINEISTSSNYPLVISCDLNESPNTYGYKYLSSNLNDAFLKSGFGLGSTMVSPYPLRIDYLLHNNYLSPSNFKVGKDVISDHYPIWCDFSFQRSQ